MLSELPGILGMCPSDRAGVARAVNGAQRRLLMAREAGDESWYGTWAEIAFTVIPSNPQIVLPRGVARLEAINVRNCVSPIRNQFYEYLQFGNGRLPKILQCPRVVQVLSRNNAITFIEMTAAPQYLIAVPTDAADLGKRVLFQGLDQNNNVIYSQDGPQRVTGQFAVLAFPFTTVATQAAPLKFNKILGIQKDVTSGPVQIMQMDPSTGNQTLLLTMEPSEETASYRRYVLNPVPCDPCQIPTCNVATQAAIQCTAIAKLELIPVVAETDYLLLQNLEAIIEECQYARYNRFDKAESKKIALQHHKNAIGLLNGELSHYYGKNDPEVNFKPFGDARLEYERVSMM